MKVGTAAIIVTMMLVFGYGENVSADLIVRGMGTVNAGGEAEGQSFKLIYDTEQDITWLDYTKSRDDWWAQDYWVADLVVNYLDLLLNDWRGPSVGDNPSFGFEQTTSEMGHLYYLSLGNEAGGPLENTGPFNNLKANWYWAGAEYSPNISNAWNFDFNEGRQHDFVKGGNCYVLAVLPGDVPQDPNYVPIPPAVWLLGSGLVGLFGLRRKMR